MESHQLRKFFALAIFTSAALPVSTVQGQDGAVIALEEIIVTAAYREQGLQDVPISISAVTGDTMVAAAIQKAEDIQFLVPNFTLTETGIGTNAFIRGIGSGINQAFEQSVGTYIDGVYFGRAQQWRAPFLDVERVEVLRGPQSILFGKNSVAGALNITTAKPADEFETSLMVSNEFENNELIGEGMISGPISDRVRYRFAARARDLDGHMENATLNNDEPSRQDWTARGILEFDVSDTFTATLKAEVGEFEVVGRHIEIVNEQIAIAGPFAGVFAYNEILTGVFGADSSVSNVVQDEVRSSNGDFSDNESENFVLTLDWTVGDFDLKSITAFSSFEYDEFCDCDFTGAVVFGAALQETYDQFSQEFRLSSPLGDKIDYIAGLYYQTSDHDFADQIIVPGNSVLVPALGAPGPLVANTQASRLATVENDVLSAFAQVNWHLNDTVTLQIGGRVTNDERDGDRNLSIVDAYFVPLPAGVPADAFLFYGWVDPFPGGYTMPCTAASDPDDCSGALGELPVEGSRDETKFSPEVKFIFNAGDNVLVYVGWSQGFKSGSFDFRANNKNFYDDMATSFEFDDEEASNFEVGGKNTLAGGALELNWTAFFTEYDDLQISIFDSVLGFNVGNAASAEILGLEVDMRWAATDHLTIAGGFALTDFEFTDFENGQCYFGATPNVDLDGNGTPELCSYTGNSNQLVSDVQGNVSFDFRVPVGNSMEFGALFDVFYTSEYDASATFDPGLVQDSYALFNARFGIGDASGRWEIAVLGKNLSDEKVLSFGGDTPLAGSSFGAKSNYAFYNPGRTIAVQGLLRF
jgi:outer membrane receptor protein involved in Fe transport